MQGYQKWAQEFVLGEDIHLHSLSMAFVGTPEALIMSTREAASPDAEEPIDPLSGDLLAQVTYTPSSITCIQVDCEWEPQYIDVV